MLLCLFLRKLFFHNLKTLMSGLPFHYIMFYNTISNVFIYFLKVSVLWTARIKWKANSQTINTFVLDCVILYFVGDFINMPSYIIIGTITPGNFCILICNWDLLVYIADLSTWHLKIHTWLEEKFLIHHTFFTTHGLQKVKAIYIYCCNECFGF